MAIIRKTITITVQQEAWIEAKIAAGHFANESEYVHDLIRRDQARQAGIKAVRDELIKGEESGEPQPFDGGLFKQRMVAKHLAKGC